MFENCTLKYVKNDEGNFAVKITYPLESNGSRLIKSIPMNEDNTDYQNILKWVEEGNTIQEAD